VAVRKHLQRVRAGSAAQWCASDDKVSVFQFTLRAGHKPVLASSLADGQRDFVTNGTFDTLLIFDRCPQNKPAFA